MVGLTYKCTYICWNILVLEHNSVTVRVHLLFLATLFVMEHQNDLRDTFNTTAFLILVHSVDNALFKTPIHCCLVGRRHFAACAVMQTTASVYTISGTCLDRIVMDVMLIGGMMLSATCTSHPAVFQTLWESPDQVVN